MSNGVIDPMTGPKYVLEGRLVTMGPAGVIEDGAIFIDKGEIKAVKNASEPPEPGFEDATRVRTGDTIYPGLIELHNHLCYNAMPLWDVPQRYSNNGQWKGHPDYRCLITKPSQVLGRTEGVVEAMVRFVECRCLLGGVTTTQGITLSSSPGIQTYYQGIVRNVEQTGEPAALPEAGTRIGNPSSGKAQEYLATLSKHSCYLQHLSEGTDDIARGWFQRLQLDDGSWAITNALSGIHSTALGAEQLAIVAEHGGSVVWSPTSNLLLYGGTLDLQAARAAGVRMGMGCDWAPSGTKNLLGELKVAWLVNQQQGAPYSAAELVAMATVDAARILKWDQVMGSIEPGRRADLIAINGQQGDAYEHLIEARETALTLVVINGVPRVGQRRLMEALAVPATEEITVGRSTRLLNLAQETSHPLVRDLSLSDAVRRLQDAMQNLPALARALDEGAGDGGGLFGGSIDSDGTTWRVACDFDFEEGDEHLLAAQPLADFVQPMRLEGITVADDPSFLPKLVAARNLPDFIKRGLPPLYGEEIPIPDSAEFLEHTTAPVLPQLRATTRGLSSFLRTWGELSLADRRVIVEQALVLLSESYVHLPLKRAMHSVDPVQRLRLLHHRLSEADEGELPPEIELHNVMASIFHSLRDLHTTYRLPTPFKERTAWLPYLIEEYWQQGRRRYLVSKVIGDAGPASFQPGVEVLHWNGIPIDKAVAQNAERQAGGNQAARHARGIDSLTLRPLARGLPPEEEWVTLHYRPLGSDEVAQYTQEWLVFEPGRGTTSLDPEALLGAATALGLDAETDDVCEAKKVLYAASAVSQEDSAAAGTPFHADGGWLPTFLPTFFRARPVDDGNIGYLRIFSFNVQDADVFVDEAIRLLGELPQNGLIIDVRGNGGGLIHAAERLLQILTPRHIEPLRAQFINSPLNLQLCRRNAPSPLFPELDLSPWIESISQSVETGATYSLSYPITDERSCNSCGQRYWGPVVLITDALCYSATDMFAASFKDHEIGPILGVSACTGAGGANVWSHRLLCALLEPADGDGSQPASPYRPLPHGSDLRVAIRRSLRVGNKAGAIIEDLGVRPDEIHLMTRDDLLHGNRDLIAHATGILAGLPRHAISVSFQQRPNQRPLVQIETSNVTRLDVMINDRPRGSFDISDDGGVTTIDLQELLGASGGDELTVEVLGFEGQRIVASRRERI